MDFAGAWDLTMKTPMGAQKAVLTLAEANNKITGTLKMQDNRPSPLTQCKLVGTTVTMQAKIKKPVSAVLAFAVVFEGESVSGTCTSSSFSDVRVTGVRFIAPVDPRGLLKRWKDFMFG